MSIRLSFHSLPGENRVAKTLYDNPFTHYRVETELQPLYLSIIPLTTGLKHRYPTILPSTHYQVKTELQKLYVTIFPLTTM